jgi:hypothetical protein
VVGDPGGSHDQLTAEHMFNARHSREPPCHR